METVATDAVLPLPLSDFRVYALAASGSAVMTLAVPSVTALAHPKSAVTALADGSVLALATSGTALFPSEGLAHCIGALAPSPPDSASAVTALAEDTAREPPKLCACTASHWLPLSFWDCEEAPANEPGRKEMFTGLRGRQGVCQDDVERTPVSSAFGRTNDW
mmetsp:Transcript_11368/g.31755  ORF Transcript_11368/g.31755 Transcript_11368/m.31755 type:complete len:163 (-) Transcript_11368:888-1376(-)